MKRGWVKYVLALGCLLAVTLGLALLRMRCSLPRDAHWVSVSTPVFRIQTNAGVFTPLVEFRLSNIGPKAVDAQVWWFECRSKQDRGLLGTNQLKGVPIPLSPGASSNLIIDLFQSATPVEDRLACCKILWFERESTLRRATKRLLNIFDPEWAPRAARMTNGCVFAANVGVADYFRLMYGWTRQTWLEDLARMESAGTGAIHTRFASRPSPPRTAEYLTTQDARGAFVEFCQSFTNVASGIEGAAGPNATPPYR